jgi:hypothetical protein
MPAAAHRLRHQENADRETTRGTLRTEPSPKFLAREFLIFRKGTSPGSPGFGDITHPLKGNRESR